MRIAMCDDEPIILDELQKFCTACYERAGISPTWLVSSDPNCFIDELEAFEPELILLDIDMPRLTGFDIAGELLQRNNRALLIFITNQESLVYETFQYKPFDFVRKSRYHEDLERVLLRAAHGQHNAGKRNRAPHWARLGRECQAANHAVFPLKRLFYAKESTRTGIYTTERRL